MSKLSAALLLVLIVGVGFYFRVLLGLNWDAGYLLHPDERFLSMVTCDIELPSSIAEYFDSSSSPLNPYNRKFTFFVYGTFPLFLTKIIAVYTGFDGYGLVNILGRIFSSLFDLGTLLILYLIGTRLYSREVGLLASALLALSVLNIQLSHFYGVETYCAFFVALTFYLCLFFWESPCSLGVSPGVMKGAPLQSNNWAFIAAGIAFGFALASKISSIFFVPFLGLFAFFPLFLRAVEFWKSDTKKLLQLFPVLLRAVFLVIGSFVLAAIVFRIFQPYAFAGGHLVLFSSHFVASMREILALMNGADMPPSLQWVGRTPVLFSLYNMVVWGMGVCMGMAVVAGVCWSLYELLAKRKFVHFYPLSWALFWFLYQSTQFVKAGRYLSIAYPFFALLAAYLLLEIYRKISCFLVRRSPIQRGLLAASPLVVVIGGTVLWAVAFTNIYRQPVTRVAASRWILRNIPCGNILASEHWDDSLPLSLTLGRRSSGCYHGLQFQHFLPDSEEKLERTLMILKEADYIVLSSNRFYMTVPRLPERFPFSTEYYRMLFSGELGFDLEKTFTSYPNVFGVEFNSDNAEEPFSVYDHPKVFIFKKGSRFDLEAVRERLSDFPLGVVKPLV